MYFDWATAGDDCNSLSVGEQFNLVWGTIPTKDSELIKEQRQTLQISVLIQVHCPEGLEFNQTSVPQIHFINQRRQKEMQIQTMTLHKCRDWLQFIVSSYISIKAGIGKKVFCGYI